MKTFVMNESLFQCQKIITQRDVENKQLKEENEKLRNQNENENENKQLRKNNVIKDATIKE